MLVATLKTITFVEKYSIMERLLQHYTRLLANTNLNKQRYLFNQIDWKNRLIGITGARGTGKTTLLLQHIKQEKIENTSLYVSLDNIYFSQHTLSDLADEFYINGGTHLFLDEVHRYANWAIEIKNIYDSYPSLFIIFTGSSILEIYRAQVDLSRRSVMYSLSGLSFREFLYFEDVMEIPPYSLEDILSNHTSIASEITSSIKVFPYFRSYLQYGVYPFYKEGINAYYDKLNAIINVILENDLPAVITLQYATILKIKKLLTHIATLVPYTPNVNDLSGLVETDRKSLLSYLNYLERAGLLRQLRGNNRKLSEMAKPEKLFLDNTNLLYSLSQNTQEGTLRETFFANQFSHSHKLLCPDSGDFLVDEKYIFEVGGKSKSFKQIRNIENSFIAYDNMEIGLGNKIPVWLFGLMY